MPTYDYKCHRCGSVFEVKQRFSDEPLTTHEQCGGDLERLISAPALQFKGSGWYITDYAKNSGAPNGSSKPAGETKTETKSESSTATESKPSSSSSTSNSDTK